MNKMEPKNDNKQYILQTIGVVEALQEGYRLSFCKNYHKALMGLSMFSHGLLFYGSEAEDRPFELQLVALMHVNENGEVYIACNTPIPSGTVIYDLKPYFPCEDRVLVEAEQKVEKKQLVSHFTKWQAHDKEQLVGLAIGEIRKIGERYRILLNERSMSKVSQLKKGQYIQIFWWFDRFDKPVYRKAVTCDPPYEHAPKTGIFASRSPVRPNPIAMTTCKVTGLMDNGIEVVGLDCLDHTPIIGMLTYEEEKFVIDNWRVPSYLSHWPSNKCFDLLETSKDLVLGPSANEILKEQLGDKKCYKGRMKNREKESIAQTDNIEIIGARQNNLKNIDVKIPYQKLTVVTGVSGSGKSSLVFDTLFAESQRRWLEHLSMMQRNSFDQLEKPDIDRIEGLPPAIAISQKTIGRHPRSTVGTLTELSDYLKQLFVKLGVRHCPKCGRALNIMTEGELIAFMMQFNGRGYEIQPFGSKQSLFILNPLESIRERNLTPIVKEGLKIGKGAILMKLPDGEQLVLQTTQMCYECETFLFELNSSSFSFNQPESMCPDCKGMGIKMVLDAQRIVENPDLSLLEGASSWWGKLKDFIKRPNANWTRGEVVALARKMKVDLYKPWKDLPEEFRNKAIWGSDEEVTFSYENKNGRSGEITRQVSGAYKHITRYIEEGNSGEAARKLMACFMKQSECDTCKGERLNREARSVTLLDKRYPEVLKMAIKDLGKWLKLLSEQLDEASWEKVQEEVVSAYNMTAVYDKAGLGYLSLDRSAPTLSGGELQRLKLVKQLQSEMINVLYVLDEPSMGLSHKDTEKIITLMQELIMRGNTVVAVEHDRQIIEAADYLIEIGPRAGKKGGQLIACGTVQQLMEGKTSLTGQYLSGKRKVELQGKVIDEERDAITIKGAYANNLKHISVSIPYGAMTVITGVSGAGKSSLLHQVLGKAAISGEEVKCEGINGLEVFDQVIEVGQQPIGKSPRSNPITYIGGMDDIRELFASQLEAKERKYTAKMFSFNNKEGSCIHCNGLGKVNLAASFMPDTWVRCPICRGKRYKKEVLEIRYQGKNIDEVLSMTVEEAASFFSKEEKLFNKLSLMEEVGLGYLELGQSATTLSGGEAQRLKLSKQLGLSKEGKKLYLLDEPTTGLHFEDMQKLLIVLRKLTDQGHTVVMIEHQVDMIKNCDWQLEIGPEGGDHGGYLIYEGVPCLSLLNK